MSSKKGRPNKQSFSKGHLNLRNSNYSNNNSEIYLDADFKLNNNKLNSYSRNKSIEIKFDKTKKTKLEIPIQYFDVILLIRISIKEQKNG